MCVSVCVCLSAGEPLLRSKLTGKGGKKMRDDFVARGKQCRADYTF